MINRNIIQILFCTFLVMIFCSCAIFAATFAPIYQDGAGVGVNDTTSRAPVGGNPGTTLGEQRKNVMLKAFEILGKALDSTVPINVAIQFEAQRCIDLGNAAPTTQVKGGTGGFTNAPFAGTYYPIALANKIAGKDIDPADNDVNAAFNISLDDVARCPSSLGWYYGYDHKEGDKDDLLGTVIHEIAHGLGFGNFVDLTTGELFMNLPDIYTRFTLDTTTGKHWHEMTDAERVTSGTNEPNVVWDGPKVDAAASGFVTSGMKDGHVRLATSFNPVSNGSSINHWAQATVPNLLMEPFASSDIGDSGNEIDLTVQLFEDIGWTILKKTTTPDIKANGSDGPVTPIDDLSITVALDSGGSTGTPADWWILASTPFGWIYLSTSVPSWTLADTPLDIPVAIQIPLVSFSAIEIFNFSAASLPSGPYTFYFAIDTAVNGVIDSVGLAFDSVTVVIP